MSKTNNLQHFLKDLADSIREKTGKTGSIHAQEFSNEIKNIKASDKRFYKINHDAITKENEMICSFAFILNPVDMIFQLKNGDYVNVQYGYFNYRSEQYVGGWNEMLRYFENVNIATDPYVAVAFNTDKNMLYHDFTNNTSKIIRFEGELWQQVITIFEEMLNMPISSNPEQMDQFKQMIESVFEEITEEEYNALVTYKPE